MGIVSDILLNIHHFTYRAGQSAIVSIQVNSTQLAVWSIKGSWVVEPGQFAIKVGTSDQTFLNTTLNVVA